MPVMDGYETTRKIRTLEQQGEGKEEEKSVTTALPYSLHRTKIIAVTGSAFEEDRAQILATGCDDFIRKPVQENLLLDRLAYYLGVQYRYGESKFMQSSYQHNTQFTPSRDALTVMPSDWIIELNIAARECHQGDVLHLLDQIPQEHELLATSLKQLATDFCFEDIVALTDRE